MSITIGYKQVDAAYVPVAVAIPCDSTQDGSKCTNKIYELQRLEGINSTQSRNQSPDAKATAQRLIDDFNRAKGALQASELDRAAKSSSLDAAQNALNAKQSALKSLKDKQVGTAEEDLQLQKEAEALKPLQNAVDAARVALDNANTAVVNAQKTVSGFDAKQIADALEIVQGSNDKKDAYSVFGSFDANTKAEVGPGTKAQGAEAATLPKGEAALVLGKVFSTGVASQNLTEGLRDYYSAVAVSRARQSLIDCLVKADTLIDGSLKKLAIEACTREPRIATGDTGGRVK